VENSLSRGLCTNYYIPAPAPCFERALTLPTRPCISASKGHGASGDAIILILHAKQINQLQNIDLYLKEKLSL
jgi:hypothetical protein